MNSIDLVREFHVAIGQPISDEPYVHDDAINALRVDLLEEELCELADALDARDPVAVLDALTDLQYVLDGAYLSLGFAHVKDAATAEVHASNLTKLGPDGNPVRRADGKVLKGPGYRPPDLAPLLTLPPFVVPDPDEWLDETGEYRPVDKRFDYGGEF